jgi:hypothetical protein
MTEKKKACKRPGKRCEHNIKQYLTEMDKDRMNRIHLPPDRE